MSDTNQDDQQSSGETSNVAETADIKEQIDQFFALSKTSFLTAGEPAYAISAKWFNKWRTDFENLADKKIDNNSIEKDGKLKSNLIENHDYRILTKAEWDLLFSWYGGGPIVELEVINHPLHKKAYAIIKYIPIVLKYKEDKKTETVHECILVDDYLKTVRSLFEIPDEDEIQLIDYCNDNFVQLMEKGNTLKKFNLQENQPVLVDYKTSEGKWYSDKLHNTHRNFYDNYYSSPSLGPGKVGLSNIGNTCFFNSGVQCLMHSVPLMAYLLSPGWQEEINERNPIGMKGRFVRCFQKLADQIWNGNSSVLTPSDLKYIVGEKCPQFAGYGQQDSHELMTFMLDGIHEDLNRCKEKPYIDGINGDGSNDLEVADESWNRYLKRNDSIIVDIFQGQIRSTLLCPNCQKTTVVFDPYMALSLPITKPTTTTFPFRFIPYDYLGEIQKFKVVLPNNFTIEKAQQLICDVLERNVKLLLLTKSYSNTISTGFQKSTYYYQPEYFALKFQMIP